MAPKRHDNVPSFKFSFWKKEGKLWYAEREDLLKAISESKNSDYEMRRTMGYGYKYI